MRNFLHSVELPNLVKSVNAWRKPSVEAEDLSFDYCSQGQVIEKLSELLPDIGVSILSEALIVEPIASQGYAMVYLTLG